MKKGFEADPSAAEEAEKSEGGRLRMRSASDEGEEIPRPPSPPIEYLGNCS